MYANGYLVFPISTFLFKQLSFLVHILTSKFALNALFSWNRCFYRHSLLNYHSLLLGGIQHLSTASYSETLAGGVRLALPACYTSFLWGGEGPYLTAINLNVAYVDYSFLLGVATLYFTWGEPVVFLHLHKNIPHRNCDITSVLCITECCVPCC